MKPLALCLLLLLGAGVVLADTVLTWSDVRIVTTDGWEYPHVGAECRAGDSQLVIILADGSRRRVDRARVRVIMDSNGEDITELVVQNLGEAQASEEASPAEAQADEPAAAMPAPAEPEPAVTAPLKPPPAAAIQSLPTPTGRPAPRPRSLEYFRLRPMITGGFGFGSAFGEWYEGISSGPQLDLGARIPIMGNMYLGATFRRQYLGVDSSLKRLQGYDIYGNYVDVTLDWNVHIDEIFFLVGVTNRPRNPQSPLFYFDMGLGMLNHSIKATATDGVDIVSAESDESKGAILLGFGAVRRINERVGLDFGVDGKFFWTESRDAFGTTHYSGTGMLMAGRIAIVGFFGG